MKKENLAFLVIGFAFGVLMGAVVLNALQSEPDLVANASLAAGASAPAGPMAPTEVGNAGGGAAPMMAELRDLRKRIKDNPDDVAALVRLANLHQDISDFDNAIGYYEQALEARPDDPDLLTDMGICYRGKGEFDRALELFETAMEAHPSHWQSLFNVVIVTGFDKGDFVKAFEALDRLAEEQPQLPQLVDLRAALEKARGDS